MPRARLLLAILLMFPLLGAGYPVPAGTRRIIAGRCITGEGKAPQAGRISFRPDDRAQTFLEAWSTPLDAEGRYRIELVDASQRSLGTGEMVTSRAAGRLRFEVLAPGYRAEAGVVATPPGTAPLTCDVRLTAQAWRQTEWQLVDAAGRPVTDGEVSQKMAGGKEWAHLRTDTNGLCRVSNPPGRGYGITAWRPGSVLTSVGAMGTTERTASGHRADPRADPRSSRRSRRSTGGRPPDRSPGRDGRRGRRSRGPAAVHPAPILEDRGPSHDRP